MTDRPLADGEPSLPDDVWEQFERDNETRIRASAPKEPSARARMVAERLRREDEAAARQQRRGLGRRRRKKTVRAQPDGWRAWPTGGRQRRQRDWVATVVVLSVLAAVLLLALYPWRTGYR
ncbi:hypothetical protein ACH4SP_06480 [Streptomyces sp. NPDC021093]|uniref:hypothetical protein n=1 Tax=Streptomyces sp. NPDC021093 TaxID=3365112 RepID=UPI00378B5C9F